MGRGKGPVDATGPFSCAKRKVRGVFGAGVVATVESRCVQVQMNDSAGAREVGYQVGFTIASLLKAAGVSR
jgi:hypothetical protein